MAVSDKHSRGGYVDISSNSQVKKVYKRKGRVKRVLIVIFSVLFLVSGSGLLYYYSVLSSLNYNFTGNTVTNTKETTDPSLGSENSNLT